MFYTIRNAATGDTFEFDTTEEAPSGPIFDSYAAALADRDPSWGEVAHIENAAKCLVNGGLDEARDELRALGMALVDDAPAKPSARTPQEIASTRARGMVTEDPETAISILTYLMHEALFLSVKAEWEMEDNFELTEWVMRELSPVSTEVTRKEIALVADEYDLPHDRIDTDRYPQAEGLDDDENEEN